MNRIELQASQLTPPGRAALATIAVWGPGASRIVARHFRAASGRSIAQLPSGRVAYGHWRSHPDEQIEEELTVARLGDERLEIHCHGGSQAPARILADLQRSGCHIQDWSEWQRQQTTGVLEAEAALQLSAARTHRTAAILLDQYRGVLTRALERAAEGLRVGDRTAAARIIGRLLELSPLAGHLTAPFRVLIVGPPNVGKSSLVNCMAGFPRCIVFEQPGTTRDLVSADLAIDGWPIELTDSAGLRPTDDLLEAAGIRQASQAAQEADLLLLVSELGQTDAPSAFASLPAQVPRIHVASKCDLCPGHSAARGAIATSAKTGEGVQALMSRMTGLLVPAAPEPGEAVPLLERHVAPLQTAWAAINASRCGEALIALQSLQVASGAPEA